MFVNHLCEAKGEQNSQADKAQKSFCQLVIASGDAPIALDSLEEVYYVYCRSRDSISMEIIASAIFGRSFFTFGLSRMIGSTYQ